VPYLLKSILIIVNKYSTVNKASGYKVRYLRLPLAGRRAFTGSAALRVSGGKREARLLLCV
jgi:hypothetical protein